MTNSTKNKNRRPWLMGINVFAETFIRPFSKQSQNLSHGMLVKIYICLYSYLWPYTFIHK